MNASDDLHWMRRALEEARLCLRADGSPDDVPVGAICVSNGAIVGRGCNARELWNDPTAHAETIALRQAARALGTSQLNGVTLIRYARTLRDVRGRAVACARINGAWCLARGIEKAGACGSVFDVARDPRLNHRVAKFARWRFGKRVRAFAARDSLKVAAKKT